MTSPARLRQQLQELIAGAPLEPLLRSELPADVDLLWELQPLLSRDLPIDRMESLETVFKAILVKLFDRECHPDLAWDILKVQKATGLLIKKKPYAIKASHPLGYSVFLQNPRQGFSFQRHLTHKTEVFHILHVHPGGFVFLCSYDDWKRTYRKREFEEWLAGNQNEKYEVFRYRPKPGDVVVMQDVGVVHTVIGCTLEEFATASTDMVDRLHDQNDRTRIPLNFSRSFAEAALRELPNPVRSYLVDTQQRRREHEIPAASSAGVTRRSLATSFVDASILTLSPNTESAFLPTDLRAAAIFVRRGAGDLALGHGNQPHRSGASIRVTAGDTLTIAPNYSYACAAGGEGLTLVEHRIEPRVALDKATFTLEMQ